MRGSTSALVSAPQPASECPTDDLVVNFYENGNDSISWHSDDES